MRNAGWVAIGILALAGMVRGEGQALFEARSGGYAVYRIPGLVVTRAGTMLAYCEARKTGKGDWDEIDLMIRRSTDGGKTWEPARKVAEPPAEARANPVAKGRGNGRGVTMNNPVAIADPASGVVHFLFCVNYGQCFYLRSEDDGRSFGKPVEITGTFERFRPEYEWKVLATGPGHGIRLRGGRLVVPVWLSTGTGGGGHRSSCVATIYSDDDGKHWERGAIVVNDGPETPNPSETAAVELADGRVMLNIRNESGRYRRLVSVGPDGATGWSRPAFDPALVEPICMGSLVRWPEEKAIVFANPAPAEAEKGSDRPGPARGKPRKNLTLRLSRDGGKTWGAGRVVDAGMAGYSDLAVGGDGALYCLYERGGIGGDAFDVGSLTMVRVEGWGE